MRRLFLAAPMIAGVLALPVLAGCGSADRTGAPASAPAPAPEVTRAQVGWMNTVCRQAEEIDRLKAEPATDPPGSAPFAGDRDLTAGSYLSGTPSTIDGVAEALATLPPVSSPPAERLAAESRRQIDAVRPEIDRLGEAGRSFDTPPDQLRGAATRMSQLVASVAVPQPGLSEVTSTDAGLARAHDLAPACDPRVRQQVAAPAAPETPDGAALLPRPADGTDLASCADGSCQVLVDRPTDITVAGTTFSVDTDVLPVVVSTSSPGGGGSRISTGVGSSGSFAGGATGRTATFVVDGAADGAAVIRFSSS